MNERKLLALFASALATASTAGGCFASYSDQQCNVPGRDVTASLARYEAALTPDGGEDAAGSPGWPETLADGGVALVGGYIPYAACESLADTDVHSCELVSATATSITFYVTVECAGGRRPAGLVFTPPSGGCVGDYFATMAALEAASVPAFRRLAHELSVLGAPQALVKRCRRAAREEISHARAMRSITRLYGATARRPTVKPTEVRPLEAVAIENAIEGCVREGFAALLAHHQSEAAEDRLVRSAMKRIARDETRHADLSFAIDTWARSRLDRSARARVDSAQRAAARELVASMNREPSNDLVKRAGVPSGAKGRALAKAFVSAIA